MKHAQAPDDEPLPVVTVADFAGKIDSYFDMELPDQTPPATAAELEQALRRHKAWVESLATPGAPIAGRRAFLKGADLRGMNLSRRDLRGADLAGANLEGAVLQGTTLVLANLAGANLRNADLRGAKLRLADLSGAVMDGADTAGAQFE